MTESKRRPKGVSTIARLLTAAATISEDTSLPECERVEALKQGAQLALALAKLNVPRKRRGTEAANVAELLR
jgi:hypothetical protein